jgi:hypothetical protein
MEALLTEGGRFFLTQGVLGIIVLVLGIVAYLQWREIQGLHQKRFEELERFIDARETVATAMNANSLALEANNRSMDLRTRATEEMAREVGELRRIIEKAILEGTFHDESIKKEFDTLLRRIDDYLRVRGAS